MSILGTRVIRTEDPRLLTAGGVYVAVVDAVAHLGIRHIDMPATPHRVWTAINEARKASSQ